VNVKLLYHDARCNDKDYSNASLDPTHVAHEVSESRNALISKIKMLFWHSCGVQSDQNDSYPASRMYSTLDFAVNIFIAYRFHKNCLKWEPPCSLHNSQRCYSLADWLLQLCMNIPANAGKLFELAHFWTALYVTLYWAWEQKFLPHFPPPPPAQFQISSRPVKSLLRQNMSKVSLPIVCSFMPFGVLSADTKYTAHTA
jgi:hypothetical protein